jgi:diguanylate cyclase (GGDEF)-like protein
MHRTGTRRAKAPPVAHSDNAHPAPNELDWPRLALEQLPCEAYIKDANGRYLYVNARTRARLGGSADALLGRTDHELLPKADAGRREAADLAAVLASGPVQGGSAEWRIPLRSAADHASRPGAVLVMIGLPDRAATEPLPALTDTLTGLPNDSLLFERLAQAQQRSRRTGSFAVLACLEIEDLDIVSGQHGATAAERVQLEVAQRLREATRAVDTVARIGDGRFVLLAEGVGLDQAQGIDFSTELKRRIQHQLDQGCSFGGLTIELRARSGSMLFRGLDPAPAALLDTVMDIMRQRDT